MKYINILLSQSDISIKCAWFAMYWLLSSVKHWSSGYRISLLTSYYEWSSQITAYPVFNIECNCSQCIPRVDIFTTCKKSTIVEKLFYFFMLLLVRGLTLNVIVLDVWFSTVDLIFIELLFVAFLKFIPFERWALNVIVLNVISWWKLRPVLAPGFNSECNCSHCMILDGGSHF